MTIERLQDLRARLRQIKAGEVDLEPGLMDLAAILDEVLTAVGPSPHAQAVDALIARPAGSKE